jgi:hypothetical protein
LKNSETLKNVIFLLTKIVESHVTFISYDLGQISCGPVEWTSFRWLAYGFAWPRLKPNTKFGLNCTPTTKTLQKLVKFVMKTEQHVAEHSSSFKSS